MVTGACNGVVWVGLCAAAVLAAEARGLIAAHETSSAATVAAAVQRSAPARRPTIRGAADARRAWLGAEHKGLVVHKVADREDKSLAIELRFRHDVVSVGIDAGAGVTVSRAGRSLRVTSPEAYGQLQALLAGSEAAFAARLMLAERETASELQAGEMSLLSAAAFVASLAGDVDAPRRLSTRFVEKHRGIYRPVRLRTCFDDYSREATAAWNDMQNCVDEANQDESLLNRAYRRVACNAVWLVRSESAWIEYLGCLGPGQLLPQ
jgi:hypothetical protein